jgi:acetylornithine deacetylase
MIAMVPVDPTFITEILRGLVGINSVNPSLMRGAPGEGRIAAYTARVLRDLGLQVFEYEPERGRVSIVGRLHGGSGGRSLMLNGHYDTVGIDGMPEPFSGAIRDGKLFGRGAYDMKGGLAACIGAVKALVDARVALAGDLLIAAVADEEVASIGTQDVLKHWHVDGTIVTEPTALSICLAHKGFVWVEIATRGRAAHGSKPELGIDANLQMATVLQRLSALEHRLGACPPHPLVGRPSVHAATLHGGTGWSTYAASCRLQVERRTLPGELEATVLAELAELAAPVGSDDHQPPTLTHVLTRAPFEADRQSAVVRAVDVAVRRVLADPPQYIGETPWMDAAFFAAAGVDTIVVGPAGGGAHSAEEWVDVDSVMRLAAVLSSAAMEYCGTVP